MKSNSTIQNLKDQHGNLGYSDEDWIEAMLDEVVRENVREIGAAPNSKIHKAMFKLSREVWGLKNTL